MRVLLITGLSPRTMYKMSYKSAELVAGVVVNAAVVQGDAAATIPSKIVSLMSFVSDGNVTDDLRVDLVAGLPVNSTVVQSTTADVVPFNLGIISSETRCEGINISNSLGIANGNGNAVSGNDFRREYMHETIAVSVNDCRQEYMPSTNFGDHLNFGQSRKEGWRNQGGGGWISDS